MYTNSNSISNAERNVTFPAGGGESNKISLHQFLKVLKMEKKA